MRLAVFESIFTLYGRLEGLECVEKVFAFGIQMSVLLRPPPLLRMPFLLLGPLQLLRRTRLMRMEHLRLRRLLTALRIYPFSWGLCSRGG